MLECVRIALVHFDGRLSLDIYRRTNTEGLQQPDRMLALSSVCDPLHRIVDGSVLEIPNASPRL